MKKTPRVSARPATDTLAVLREHASGVDVQVLWLREIHQALLVLNQSVRALVEQHEAERR